MRQPFQQFCHSFSRPDAIVSSAFHRFRELRSRAAVESFLNFVAIDPTIVDSIRFGSYGDPMWETMADLWDPNWADTVADLFIAWAEAHITERRVDETIEAIKRLPDGGDAVGRAVLEKVLATGADLPYLPETIVSLCIAGSCRLAFGTTQRPQIDGENRKTWRSGGARGIGSLPWGTRRARGSGRRGRQAGQPSRGRS